MTRCSTGPDAAARRRRRRAATRSVGGDLERRLAASGSRSTTSPRPAPTCRPCATRASSCTGSSRVPEVGAAGHRRRGAVAAGRPPGEGQDVHAAAPARRRLRDGLGVRLPAPGQRARRGRRHRRDRARLPARPGAPVPGRPRGRAARLRWMLDSGVPPERIVVAGDSAGGGLVLSLVTTLTRQDLPLPGGTMHFCPGHRPHLRPTSGAARPSAAGVSVEQLRSFAAAYLGEHPADDDVVNALRADLTGYPPMLIQAGTGDVLGQDAHALAEHARAPRRRRAVRALPGDHARLPRVLVVPARGRGRRGAGRRVRQRHHAARKRAPHVQPGPLTPPTVPTRSTDHHERFGPAASGSRLVPTLARPWPVCPARRL